MGEEPGVRFRARGGEGGTPEGAVDDARTAGAEAKIGAVDAGGSSDLTGDGEVLLDERSGGVVEADYALGSEVAEAAVPMGTP